MILAAWLVRDLAASRALPPPPPPRKSAPASEEPTTEKSAQDQLPAYNVIVAKYLFNPQRTEGAAPDTAQQKPAVPLPPKPILLGVVVDGPTSRAYLEDPSTKRVFGYQVGDSVAGGKLEKITDDRIQISRTDGMMEVTLRDPTKPRPPAPVQPGTPPQPGAPPAARTESSPATPPTPGRAPVPPRSLRRVPVDQKSDQ